MSIHLNEEPADAVYKFFVRSGLFQKDWDVAAVIQQICDIASVTKLCKRKRAVKYYEKDVVIRREKQTDSDGGEMEDVHLGPLLIWMETEVIDAVYEFSKERNLTVPEQMGIFHHICKKSDEVYCKRTR